MRSSTSVQIKVNAVSMLKEVIGPHTIVALDCGNTLGDLINKLEEEYGSAYSKKTGEDLRDSIMKRFNLLVSGEVFRPLQDIDKMLKDGDEVLLFQYVGGG